MYNNIVVLLTFYFWKYWLKIKLIGLFYLHLQILKLLLSKRKWLGKERNLVLSEGILVYHLQFIHWFNKKHKGPKIGKNFINFQMRIQYLHTIVLWKWKKKLNLRWFNNFALNFKIIPTLIVLFFKDMILTVYIYKTQCFYLTKSRHTKCNLSGPKLKTMF